MTVDLHTHTIRSDGTTTPTRNVEFAAAAGLRGLALTDHDTVAGWEEAAAACERYGLRFVPGVELSTEDFGTSVHILGYWVDPQDPRLVEECARLRDERARRAELMVARLAALGLDIDLLAVAALAGDAPIGRPHVAQAMVDAGLVPDRDAAFDRYLAEGRPAWVEKHALAPEEGVRLIRDAGGVAVLAHPGMEDARGVDMPALVERLRAAGLAGIEADHAGHAPEVREYWRAIATADGLLVTGSSDFHGDRKDVNIGASTTPIAVVDALRGRAVAAVAAGGSKWW
ncbi:MAG: PHP domain-containing protein [Nitriliruptorales bacterium]|nr:PHP domain-containing protein [Nitriliruptorales bacterium]